LRRIPVSNPPEAPAARRDRSIPARGKVGQGKADRERRIVNFLNVGVSVAEIAAREGVTLKRMRNLVRESLAARLPQPPAEFLALQVSRLNEALLVSYTAMRNSIAGTNFEAVDRVIRIVRELDRYHGLSSRESASRPQLPAQVPLAPAPPIAEPPGDSTDSFWRLTHWNRPFGARNWRLNP
jgi:hypothetical protein